LFGFISFPIKGNFINSQSIDLIQINSEFPIEENSCLARFFCS
jgi:hypothetical protein